MSYSMCRFWAYDESKKILGAGKDAPAWKLAAAGSMGSSCILRDTKDSTTYNFLLYYSWWYRWSDRQPRRLVSIVSHVPGACLTSLFRDLSRTEIVMVRLQGDFAKPPEKRFNYKHCFDALFRVSLQLWLSCSPLLCLSLYFPVIGCAGYDLTERKPPWRNSCDPRLDFGSIGPTGTGSVGSRVSTLRPVSVSTIIIH